MNKINLMDNLIADPFTIDPKEARRKSRKVWPSKKTKKKEPEIKTIVMCGCGNHPINPKKDPYKQHNNWAAQFHPKTESGRSDIRNIKGIASTPEKQTPTYDFSGDDFEVTNEEMKKINEK
jgi:hypothetical protein